MSARMYLVTALLLALAACATSASIQHRRFSQEEDNTIDHSGITKSSNKIPILEMTKTYLRDQMTQARTSSQVLTLNLTNLIILIIIKVIILGFGFVGSFGSFGRRSSEESFPVPLIDKTDMMMALSYALGSSTDDFNCLNRMACEEPEAAHRYMTASKILLKTAKLFKNSIGYNEDYEDIVDGLEEAIEYRNKGGSCSRQYICKAIE